MSEWKLYLPKCDPNNIESVLNANRHEANMFKGAAERCDIQKRMRGNEFQWYPCAAGVLFALSIELYLKFLLTKKSKQYPFTHDLKKLFLLLDVETQEAIFEKTKYEKHEFDLFLDRNKEMFENWRYLSEDLTDKKGNKKERPDDLGFIEKLANCAGSVVNSYYT